MDTTIITSIVRETLATLPDEGVERDLTLRRTVELCGARLAAAELAGAAARARAEMQARQPGGADSSGAIAEVLSAASTLEGADVDTASRAAARLQIRRAVVLPAFLDIVPAWIAELRGVAGIVPGSGACTIATAMQLWQWTVKHFLRRPDVPEPVFSDLADAFPPLVAARCLVLGATSPFQPLATPPELLLAVSHLNAARTAGRVGAICAELVHGYRRHPTWDGEDCTACYNADELDELEGLMPGIASLARAQSDVIEADGSHPPKAGPCVKFHEIDGFVKLRTKLDGCLTGARVAGDRAAAMLVATLAPVAQI